MSAASMWTAMQAAIAAVTPYQGSDPVASDAYRAAVGQAMCTAIISEQNSPVAWDGTNDRILDVGQFTSDSFTSETSMPLHIACGDGQIYEIEIVGSSAVVAAGANPILQPNNTLPTTNSFAVDYMYQLNTTVVGNTYSASAFGGFLIASSASLKVGSIKLFTSTANKKYICESDTAWTGNTFSGSYRGAWNDTTTVWSSLGTITMPNAWTGQIVCRRIA